jgi:aryl-alcohol dehydrogenase-like predicted oxidoreductase
MEHRRLGKSGLVVTDLCLGTMMFGSRNTKEEAFAIMDRAVEAGIDFFDTAEVYPVPPRADHVHRTEEIVGEWLAGRDRDEILLASKVGGPAHGWFRPPLRHGHSALDRNHIRRAIEGSLRRLRTDYLDLYQTHWPDHDMRYGDTLDALDELVREGKVRVIGSSNENAWGLMKAESVAREHGLARYDTVQNNFSVLNRRFEDEMAFIARKEKISLLPYSPLGGGVCSGKYNDGGRPEGTRFSEYLRADGERQQAMARRFVNETSLATVAELRELADRAGHGLIPLCLAWSRQHDFVASTIFGATSLEQLEECLEARDLILPEEVLTAIDAITARHPYPLG